jgi:hypothetical protein
MGWTIVERRLGRAGGIKRRYTRQREWDAKYGADMWAVGYVVDGRFISQEEALELIYYQSYAEHFEQHPEDLEELLATAKALRNPHAEATTGVDLQVPIILDYLHRHGLDLRGDELLDIGSWNGTASHALSIRLSPLHIKLAGDPRMTLEQFWQDKKCLAVWEDAEG